MIAWLLMFMAAVVVAFAAAYLLLHPSSLPAEQHENVVPFPSEGRREKVG
jgi:hypothetical protein